MLTQQEHSALCAVTDWKAPYEIVGALYPNGSRSPDRLRVKQALEALRDRGLVKYGEANGTYKITDAGREALGTVHA